VERRDGGISFRIDIPGASAEDIDVSVREGSVTISGETRSEQTIERDGRKWRGLSRSSFSRRLAIPRTADWEQAEASFASGVLEVRIPDAGAAVVDIPIDKPHTIEAALPVNGGSPESPAARRANPFARRMV
jgi:HSP20 family molecular chaperone IbpA